MNKREKTARAVVKALGGDAAVAKLVGTTAKAVGNWRNFGWFPSDTYVVMIDALEQKGSTASPKLWQMARKGRRFIGWRGKIVTAKRRNVVVEMA